MIIIFDLTGAALSDLRAGVLRVRLISLAKAVGIHSRQGRIAAILRKAFHNILSHMVGLDLVQHFLKAGSLETRAKISIAYEKDGLGIPSPSLSD